MINQASISINDRCNLRCPYCLAEGAIGDLLSLEEKFKVLDKLNDMQVKHIDFFGKEPLYDDTLFKLVEYSREKGYPFTFSLITNGVNLGKYKERIIENENIVSCTVSYDGGYGERNFIPDLAILQELSEYIETEVTIDLHYNTLPHLLDMIEEAKKYGIDNVFINPITPQGEFSESIKDVFFIGEAYYAKVIEDLLKREGNPYLIISIPFLFRGLTDKYHGVETSDYTFLTEPKCRAGIDNMYISSNGNVSGCITAFYNGNKTNQCSFLDTSAKDIEEIIRCRGGRQCFQK